MVRIFDITKAPDLKVTPPGFRDPDQVFFDAASMQWMGRTFMDGQLCIVRQLGDGRWITQRRATADDNAKLDAAFGPLGKAVA